MNSIVLEKDNIDSSQICNDYFEENFQEYRSQKFILDRIPSTYPYLFNYPYYQEDKSDSISLIINKNIDNLIEKKVFHPFPNYNIFNKGTNIFIILHKWEGNIIEINKEGFIARLKDLSICSPDEEATFSNEDISLEERSKIIIGQVFYWYIGYVDLASGPRIKQSMIKFKRYPKWNINQINAMKIKAKLFSKYLNNV